MESENYKYNPSTSLPDVTLKEGHTGVIGRVIFYKEGDYLRGIEDQEGNNSFLCPFRDIFGNSHKGARSSLEECKDINLEMIANHLAEKSDYAIKIPLEELKELRALEQRLRSEIGDYRAR